MAARDPSKVVLFGEKLNAQVLNWPVDMDILKTVDVLINCTSLGSKIKTQIDGEMVSLEHFTPLTEHLDNNKTVAALKVMKSDAIVFDIIYDPAPTKLLRLASNRGLKTLDGQQMNLEQAVLAFDYALPECNDLDVVRKVMLKAKKQF